ncbi:MAG: YceI family protein [Paracoccus sp. (in: a-proteobacteria)]|uniref:YceI family protein n=1 Tax=Paracoccus sp. TaxID=267 RepID=UPI0026E08F5C|nr:YceI family protein [Paracoccus sp. (in: a-proteobacteria)]MDO5613125.1 YceI family protein [Paracoccus sp. (in: a-proteobacteria)]
MKRTMIAAAFAAALPVAVLAQDAPESGTYVFDSDHAQALFSWSHMGFSTSYGMVNGIEGQVVLDAENPENSTVEARFPAVSMQTVSPGLDEHLKSEDFFNGDGGEVTFVSTGVEPGEGNLARVSGDLTLNGQTQPVVLDVVLNHSGENPMAQKPAVGFTGTTVIKRSDFGLGAFVPAVSDEVQVTLNIEAMKE